MKRLLLTIAACLALVTSWAQVTRTTYDYAIKGADTLRLDIYLDQSLKTEGKRPVMIYMHGGAWSAGSRKNAAQEVYNRHFAELGFVSVSINYRLALAEGNTYGAKTLYDVIRIGNEDMVSATNFLLSMAEELNADTEAVLISGGSAGAICSLQLEYDLCNGKDYTKELPEGFNYAGIISQAGAIVMEGDTVKWEKSPCPILFIHGDNDGAVPFERNELVEGSFEVHGEMVGSKYLHEQLTQMDSPHWLYVQKGADHIMAMKALTDNLEECDKFYQSFVKEKRHSIVYTEWADAEPANMSSVEEMIKYVPFYILGFGKYLDEIDWGNLDKPKDIVY